MNALAFSPWFYLPVLISIAIAATGGFLLLIRKVFFVIESNTQTLSETINNLLPQTQCGQCGFNGCRPYANAIAAGEAINRCPPGGRSTINALAELLGEQATELNPSNGCYTPPVIARIREDECIGCTKCIQVCPVDAILGAAKLMHSVIDAECTGCDLCRAPCPVDCIDIVPAPRTTRASWNLPEFAANSSMLSKSGHSW